MTVLADSNEGCAIHSNLHHGPLAGQSGLSGKPQAHQLVLAALARWGGLHCYYEQHQRGFLMQGVGRNQPGMACMPMTRHASCVACV